jgi:hypothetical protein
MVSLKGRKIVVFFTLDFSDLLLYKKQFIYISLKQISIKNKLTTTMLLFLKLIPKEEKEG